MATTVGATNLSSSAVGTTYLDGLISGLDTTSIINQLAAIQSKPIDRLNTQKSTLDDKLSLYQSINASLAAAKIAADDLGTPASFAPNAATVTGYSAATAPLFASATTEAQSGSHSIVVQQLATAQKIASGTVADSTAALGYSGDIRINGHDISLSATDSLQTLAGRINQAGAGVTATILQVSDSDHRLILSANSAGASNAIDLVDANTSGILQHLGLLNGTDTAKHSTDSGHTLSSDPSANSALDIAQALGLVVPPQGTVLIQGVALHLNLQTDSLESIRNKINSNADLQAQNVSASIVSEQSNGATSYHLQITKSDGAVTLAEDPTDNGHVLETLGFLRQGVTDERQAAKDARVTVDGVAVTRPTNSLDDVLPGVSMELVQADPGETLTLSVSPDSDAVTKKVQTFISAYNAVVDKITGAQGFDADTNTGGLLFGDMSMLNIEDSLRRTITNVITVPGGDSSVLSAVGISTDANNHLVLDTSALQAAVEKDPNAVANLFGRHTATSSSDIEYVSSGSSTADTGAAGFVVHIEHAATRATAQSREFSGGITADETLTVNGHDITLTAGMTLEQARDHLNGWLQTYQIPDEASIMGDAGHQRLQIQHEQYGADYKVAISSSLDQSAGGTDLGGAVHGQIATHSGTDVAGTINGETCTGKGQYLTGAEGNATTAGLKLRIAASGAGNIGTVTLAQGAAARFSNYVSLLCDSDQGAIQQGEDSINRDITSLDKDIKDTQDRVQTYMDTLRERFTQMETVLGRAQALQQYMTGQIAATAKITNGTSG